MNTNIEETCRSKIQFAWINIIHNAQIFAWRTVMFVIYFEYQFDCTIDGQRSAFLSSASGNRIDLREVGGRPWINNPKINLIIVSLKNN